ncbi:DUF6089 family protein [Pinibacter soli]|uniref:DUF6089 family protein n=1 Tax=Pinibacter soli TaxID=3044211 RepID=A0ABT6RJ38_9BACT|nr:DUF6089 family protein [Pinibacter soli]MDI3322586.1 DUF6089 family protein [Pinibacter soli]
MKKFNKKISILLASGLFFAATANCQDTQNMTFSSKKAVTDSVSEEPKTKKYEFGIGGGIVVYQGDLAPTVWGAYRCISPGLQANITRIFSPSFALRIGGAVGKFTADDTKSSYKEAYRDYRKYNFTTSFAELTAMAQWTPFAKANWRLNPYLLGGAGVSYLKVKNDWSKSDFNYFAGENLQQRASEDSAKSHSFFAPILPVGVGLKYDVSDKVALKLEWINRITFTDYLDGFSKAANPNKNDRYSSIMLSLNFALGKNHKSSTSHSGSTINNYYYNYYYSSKNSKSENSMATKNGGNKQNSSSTSADNGEQQGTGENLAIQDVQNKLDLITRKLDDVSRANAGRGGNGQGNTDVDNDFNNMIKYDKYIIYFSFDHSYLEGESYTKLDQIANTMKADPKVNVTLSGFTDLRGSNDYNMKLSTARAEICRDYLISHSIDPNRIKTEAFGKTKYIIGNLSKEQQWVNRRVEVYFN